MKYGIIVFYSHEDQGYIALSEEYPDVCSWGCTKKIAKQNLAKQIRRDLRKGRKHVRPTV